MVLKLSTKQLINLTVDGRGAGPKLHLTPERIQQNKFMATLLFFRVKADVFFRCSIFNLIGCDLDLNHSIR